MSDVLSMTRDYLVFITNKAKPVSAILMCTLFFLIALSSGASLLAAEPENGLVESSGLYSLHLPAVINVFPAINFEKVWSENDTGDARRAFLIGENVQIVAAGRNQANNELQMTLSWEVQDACGETIVDSEQIDIAPGEWNISQSMGINDCKGIYTFSMQVEHLNQSTTHSSTFVINDPSNLIFQEGQAFDKCNIASVSQMQTWWDHSPYIGTNLYIGGISRYCPNTQLDAVWVYQVSQQGWSFIPTWVGPQAPCSKFKHRMSWNPDIAYQQGRQEAQAANDALIKLGFLGDRIVFYDVEAYSASSGLDECRNVVNWFLKGWTERLTELATESGVYGATCRSYASDWAEIVPPPEYVWLAYWVYPFEYKPDASVWDLPCLSNDLWADQQRIRQYVGDHYETYGGVTFHIDSNVIESDITIFPENESANVLLDKNIFEPPQYQQMVVEDMGLLTGEIGWLQLNQMIYVTEDGGDTWSEVTPHLVDIEQVLGVFFLERDYVWLVSRELMKENLKLYSSIDGGGSWHSSILELHSGLEDIIYVAQIQFIDQQHGWISVKYQTNRNFSIGSLLRTRDGGNTWVSHALPVGGTVQFIDELQGWLTGGPTGEEVFFSNNGGETWRSAGLIHDVAHSNILSSNYGSGSHILQGLPKEPRIVDFVDDLYGWAWVQSSQCHGEKVRSGEITTLASEPFRCEVSGSLLETKDGGQTWFEIDVGDIVGE
jgi:photosystem II stability/assembly factor-like uncharacterized protein